MAHLRRKNKMLTEVKMLHMIDLEESRIFIDLSCIDTIQDLSNGLKAKLIDGSAKLGMKNFKLSPNICLATLTKGLVDETEQSVQLMVILMDAGELAKEVNKAKSLKKN